VNQLLSIQSSVSSTNISDSSTGQRTFSMRDDFLAPYNIVLARFLPVVTIFEIPLKMKYSKWKSMKSGRTVSYFHGSNLGLL